MPADGDGAARSDGRRRKASKGGNRGLAGDVLHAADEVRCWGNSGQGPGTVSGRV